MSNLVHIFQLNFDLSQHVHHQFYSDFLLPCSSDHAFMRNENIQCINFAVFFLLQCEGETFKNKYIEANKKNRITLLYYGTLRTERYESQSDGIFYLKLNNTHVFSAACWLQYVFFLLSTFKKCPRTHT